MTDPGYNNARGAANLAGAPPFDFSGVIMRAFPLRANMASLVGFCDSYLNLARDIVEFEPAGPFAILQVINYGRMTSEVAAAGWVSQNEILFAVPLIRHDKKNGKRVFSGSASVSPFIFVDQEGSQITGREVYGWPKVYARLKPGISAWMRSPTEPLAMLELGTQVFLEDGSMAARCLVEIQQRETPDFLSFPPRMDSPLNPFYNLSRALFGGMAAAGDMMEMLMGLPIQGYPSPASGEFLRDGLAGLAAMDPATSPVFNTVNLKQFRDAQRPSRACYQALTNAKMTLKRLNRGGLLGEDHQLRGDSSGGFEISISRYTSQPIVEALGLEVDSESTSAEGRVRVLKPVNPFWMDVDFHYGKGETICWRTFDGTWHLPGDVPLVGAKPQAPIYNLAGGGASRELRGPFSFPNTTLRVLPLLASPAKLARFCDRYLNGLRKLSSESDEVGGYSLPNQTSFEAWGSYVYMIASNFDAVSTGVDHLGLEGQRQAVFLIPVKWFEGEGDDRRLVSVGVLRAYMYAQSDTAATTGREVQGWPVQQASLESPDDPWMTTEGLETGNRSLLQVYTDVLASLGMGEEVERRILLEITTAPILPGEATWRWEGVLTGWGAELYQELKRKEELRDREPEGFRRAQALALALLTQDEPLNDVALRQFRDALHPHKACYQALARSHAFIEALDDMREMEGRLHLGIHRYATEPIVETLGLRVKATTSSGGTTVDWLQPVRPFRARVDFLRQLGLDFFVRVHSREWKAYPLDLVFNGDWEPRVGPSLVEFIDQERSRQQRLKEAVHSWRGSAMTAAQAISAVRKFEPQLVIESLLSRGWGNRGLRRWWRRATDDSRSSGPDFCIPDDSVGPLGSHFESLHPDIESLHDYWYLGREAE